MPDEPKNPELSPASLSTVLARPLPYFMPAAATHIRLAACIAIVLSAFLMGCAGPMHYFRFPTGRTHQDFERDSRLCNLDAQTLQWNTWFGGRTAGQIDRRFVGCMTKLGYVEYQPRALTLSQLGQSRLEEARNVLHHVWQPEGNGRNVPSIRVAVLDTQVQASWEPQANEILLGPEWIQIQSLRISPTDSEQAQEYKRALDWTIPFSHEIGHALSGHTPDTCRASISACEHQANMKSLDVLERGWGLGRDAAEFKVCVWLKIFAIAVQRNLAVARGGHNAIQEFEDFARDTGRERDCNKNQGATSAAPAAASVPHGVSSSASMWFLGAWEGVLQLAGSPDGSVRLILMQEPGGIHWRMATVEWMSGVQMTREASGLLIQLSETTIELRGRYTTSNIGNFTDQPLRQRLERRAEALHGAEVRPDGARATITLRRTQ